jgi:hypothetical protein|tara:strand:+ start:18680 stop:18889 length:210 start_codon:yes stop_codon:yes gene_type:complete
MLDETLTALADLLAELATELDLHYSLTEGAELEPTLGKMERAARILQEAGKNLPPSWSHVLHKFNSKSH